MARRKRNNRRRRRGGFAPLYRLLCFALIVGAIVVALTLFFKVEHVAVAGNSRYGSVEVVTASGVQEGDNLFLMNKYDVAFIANCLLRFTSRSRSAPAPLHWSRRGKRGFCAPPASWWMWWAAPRRKAVPW